MNDVTVATQNAIDEYACTSIYAWFWHDNAIILGSPQLKLSSVNMIFNIESIRIHRHHI